MAKNEEPKEAVDFIQSIFRAMVLLGGVPPADIQTNYEHESGEGNVLIALVDRQVAITTEGDSPEPFYDDGWSVISIPTQHMRVFDGVFKSIDTFAFEYTRRGTMNAAKQTSQHEQWLIDGCISRGLPTPDRNCKLLRDDGRELTTPDLAWADYKLAFFVDGNYWHVTKDDKAIIDDLIESQGKQKSLLAEKQVRAERDLRIRSEMQARGWRVLSCSDRQLEENAGVSRQVDLIERTLHMLMNERDLLKDSKGTDLSGLDELL